MPKNTAARWTLYVVIAIAFAVACAFLSKWQFDRSATREHANELIAANYDAAPVPVDDALPDGTAFTDGATWQPIEMTGEYLADDTVLVRNRPLGGTSAFEVLVPFRTLDGREILIDRGWIPPAENSDPTAVPAPPSGEVTVIARLKPGEQLPASGRSAPEGQVPTIHLPLVAERSGTDIRTDAYAIMVSEDPTPATRPNALEKPEQDPGPHLSYAIQWILFAVMGFVFIFSMIRTERKHRREDAEDAAAAERGEAPPVRQAKRRRTDADADAEDEILTR